MANVQQYHSLSLDNKRSTISPIMEEKMQFDDVIRKTGQFGKYQIMLFLIVSLYTGQNGINNMGIVFLAGTPEHWCKSPELDVFNLSQSSLKDITVSLEERDGVIQPSSCERFKKPYKNWTFENIQEALDNEDDNGTTEYCPHGWEYDTSVYTNTIVSQWDLVCNKRWLKAVGASVYMAGLCLGVIVTTALSDMSKLYPYHANLAYFIVLPGVYYGVGRRPVLLVTVPGMVIISIGLSFSPNFITFCILRVLLAFCGFGSATCAFVLAMELIGPDYRMHAGIGTGYFWAAGYLGYAGLAYFIRDWKTLNLVASCLAIPLLITLYYVPESPRWLYVHGKKEEGDRIIKRIAKVNNSMQIDSHSLEIKLDKKGYIWDLFRTPRMACRSANLCSSWFLNSCVYYGLSLNTSNLGGNDFVNFAIAAAIEFPAYFLAQLLLHFIGRRIPLCSFMLLGGVALLSTLAVPPEMNWLLITLSMLGKFGITASFEIVYIYAAELYPTTVRSIGLGTCSFSARIGGIIAPFIGQLSEISKFIPMIIFGVMSLLGGLLALILPETRGKSLPETLEDGENFGRNVKTEAKKSKVFDMHADQTTSKL